MYIVYYTCIKSRFHIMWFVVADSVEEGEKLVKTAIDNFGRIGK